MRLTVVGCAGSFPGPDSAASCYLVQADDADGRTWTVLLDLGNGALGAAAALRRPDRASTPIGLSHLHADHVADLVGAQRAAPVPPGRAAARRSPVHGPTGTAERLAQLSGQGPRDQHATGSSTCVEWQAGAPVARRAARRSTPVPVEHPVPAFGIRVTGPATHDPAPDRDARLHGRHRRVRRVSTTWPPAPTCCWPRRRSSRAATTRSRGVHLTGRRAGEAAAARRRAAGWCSRTSRPGTTRR